MTTAGRSRLRRTIERTLLARDRVEITAADRVLSLLQKVARRKRTRAGRRRVTRVR
jgi:hypothetical protein